MNIYVLVEGKTEKPVYKSWISYVNPELTYVSHPSELIDNQFSIVSAMGYPGYFQHIDSAVADVATSMTIDRLVVAIDSEEMTREEKYNEVEARILSSGVLIDYRIIVQHFCIETWALGNRRIVGVLPQSPDLRGFKNVYDVRENDPEGLPAQNEWNRAQFAYQYLRAAFRDRRSSLTYSKGKPGLLQTESYFQQLQKRLSETDHISSFGSFMRVFR